MVANPLRIDALPLPGLGTIGLTFCPGKRDPHGLAGPHQRDLETDMRAIADWGPKALVTLIEAWEMDHLGVPDLGPAAERLGLDWHWLPLPDGGVPDGAFERWWQYSGPCLRRHLRAGAGVVVHCRGGLGRAGVVASRLLVEMGWEPAGAIESVRRTRPGAVETAAQETFLQDRAPGTASRGGPHRLLGALLGGALGDALGYPVEFWDADRIRTTYGPAGVAEPPLTSEGGLAVSDDTQMTLFTLAGLLEAGGREAAPETALDRIQAAYAAWLTTQEGPPSPSDRGPIARLATDARLQKVQAPGTTCLRALRTGGRGTPEAPINHSKGCGGVMRVAPVGLIPDWPPETAFEVGARSAALTHGHPAGYAAAGALAAMMRLLMGGRPLSEAVMGTFPLLRGPLGDHLVCLALEDALERVRVPAPDPLTDVQALGAGWVAEEALAIGVYAAGRGQDFRDAVRIGASHGGDSDSTAAIAGQLVGARTGIQDLPHAWVRRLDVAEPLLDRAADGRIG